MSQILVAPLLTFGSFRLFYFYIYFFEVVCNISLTTLQSVSGFARNTVDSLTTVRKLKEHGIECYFEKKDPLTAKVP